MIEDDALAVGSHRFLACQHLASLQLARVPAPDADNAQADLIRRKGDEHERAYLEELRARGREIVEIERDDWERAAAKTVFQSMS